MYWPELLPELLFPELELFGLDGLTPVIVTGSTDVEICSSLTKSRIAYDLTDTWDDPVAITLNV